MDSRSSLQCATGTAKTDPSNAYQQQNTKGTFHKRSGLQSTNTQQGNYEETLMKQTVVDIPLLEDTTHWFCICCSNELISIIWSPSFFLFCWLLVVFLFCVALAFVCELYPLVIDMIQTGNNMQIKRVKDCQAEVSTLDSTPNPKSTFKPNLEPSDQNEL
jgi:hypothetical protein